MAASPGHPGRAVPKDWSRGLDMGVPGGRVQLPIELVDDLTQGTLHAFHGGVLHLGDKQAHLCTGSERSLPSTVLPGPSPSCGRGPGWCAGARPGPGLLTTVSPLP